MVAFQRILSNQAIFAKWMCWLVVFLCVDVLAISNKKQPLLAVLVDFNDEKFTYSKDDFERLLFGNENSVRSYFLENSYDQLSIEPAIKETGKKILSVSVAEDHPSCSVDYCRYLIEKVFQEINSLVDFKSFDASGDGKITPDELSVLFVFAGYEAGVVNSLEPAVRSHQYTGINADVDGVSIGAYAVLAEKIGVKARADNAFKTNKVSMNSLGTTVHELGHLILGLPDLYNSNENHRYPGKISAASVDYQMWGLMASGAVAGKPQGSQPVQLSGYSKLQAGFLEPRDFTEDAVFTLKPLNKHKSLVRVWLDPYKHRQYLLLEYRDDDALKFFSHQNSLASSVTKRNVPYKTQGLLVSKVDSWVKNNDKEDQKLILSVLNEDNDMLSGMYSGLSGVNTYDSGLIKVDINNVSFDYQREELNVAVQTQGETTKDSLGFVKGTSKYSGLIHNLKPSNFIVQMDLDDVQLIDGIDLYLSNANKVSVKLASDFIMGINSYMKWGNEVYKQNFNLANNATGWVRLMFDQPVAVSQHEKLLIYIDLGSDGRIGYFSGEKQGVYFKESNFYQDASSKNFTSELKISKWEDSKSKNMRGLDHDLGVRLLVDRERALPIEFNESMRPVEGLQSVSTGSKGHGSRVKPQAESNLKNRGDVKVESRSQQNLSVNTGNQRLSNEAVSNEAASNEAVGNEAVGNEAVGNESSTHKSEPGSSGGAVAMLWLLILLPLLLRKPRL